MTTEPTEQTERETPAGAAGFVESFRTVVEGLQESANVERVYGEPIETDRKTVVPVARIAYGFGGGFGSGTGPDEETSEGGGEGGGTGGGMTIQPVGALEITEQDTRFVRFADRKRLALAVGVGAVLGILLGRR